MKRVRANPVVVITGASTGIGRATARRFAREGGSLVLASRNAGTLEQVARECQALGAQTHVVVADVTDELAVRRVAQEAVRRFGRVDLWFNNAGVGAIGPLDRIPAEESRRVIETNLLGTLYGAREAVKVFRRQRYGVLINNASMASWSSMPWVGAYVASKHGVQGLSMSLRQDLILDGLTDVHVCVLMPSPIDTPAFQHASNHTEHAVKIPSTVIKPERVADVVYRLYLRPRRSRFVGNLGRIAKLAFLLAPATSERVTAKLGNSAYLDRTRRPPPRSGNLFQPLSGDGWTTDGGWRRGRAAWVAGLGVGLLLPALLAARRLPRKAA